MASEPTLGPMQAEPTLNISERMSRVEGEIHGLREAVSSLRHSQTIIAGVMALGFTFLLAAVGFSITQIDRLNDRFDALPGQFMQMNQTLAAAINAAHANPPQVILMPAPTVPSTPQK